MHPGRYTSLRFAFERQSLSFCILWCITNFTIAHCTVSVFNYHFERLKVFWGFYMVRQTVSNFRFKALLIPKVTWLCAGVFKFKDKSTCFSQTKKSLINLGLRILVNIFIDFGAQFLNLFTFIVALSDFSNNSSYEIS